MTATEVFQRAVKRYQAGDLRGAERLAEKALRSARDSSEIMHFLGVVRLSAGEAEKAIAPLERAADLDPNSREILSNLGAALLQAGDPAGALGSLDRALALAPDSASTFYNRAAVYRALERPAEAAIDLKRVAEIEGETPDLLCEIGVALADAGDLDVASAAFEKALALGPDNERAREGLAYIQMQQNRPQEAAQIYGELADRHPDVPRYRTEQGVALAKLGRGEAAIEAFRVALSSDPRDFAARASLGRLYDERVPPWHFTMLNDAARNEAYDAAIRRAVRPGSLVLDIGTGSGLLAMMAVRAGAEHVYACEMVPVIAEAAKAIIAANGFGDRITVLAKSSAELVVGEDLPRPADVIVSEVVDVVLLGEEVVPTMEDAVRRLAAPDATIIPQGGAIHACLVECEALHRQDRVSTAAGFDVSAFNEFSRNRYFTTGLHAFEWRALSEPLELFRLDFTRPGIVSETREVELAADAAGTAHAVVVWFSLDLDGQTTISSEPRGQNTHWMQAVFLFDRPDAVLPNDRIGLAVRHDCTHLHLLIANTEYGLTQFGACDGMANQ